MMTTTKTLMTQIQQQLAKAKEEKLAKLRAKIGGKK